VHFFHRFPGDACCWPGGCTWRITVVGMGCQPSFQPEGKHLRRSLKQLPLSGKPISSSLAITAGQSAGLAGLILRKAEATPLQECREGRNLASYLERERKNDFCLWWQSHLGRRAQNPNLFQTPLLFHFQTSWYQSSRLHRLPYG
jgi:hypothetical protein